MYFQIIYPLEKQNVHNKKIFIDFKTSKVYFYSLKIFGLHRLSIN